MVCLCCTEEVTPLWHPACTIARGIETGLKAHRAQPEAALLSMEIGASRSIRVASLSCRSEAAVVS